MLSLSVPRLNPSNSQLAVLLAMLGNCKMDDIRGPNGPSCVPIRWGLTTSNTNRNIQTRPGFSIRKANNVDFAIRYGHGIIDAKLLRLQTHAFGRCIRYSLLGPCIHSNICKNVPPRTVRVI